MQIVVVYDDTCKKSEVIADIIGEKNFGDVVVKKQRLEDYYKSNLLCIYPDLKWKRIHSLYEYIEIIKEVEAFSSDTKILHCFSNFLISDSSKASLSFEKLVYVDDSFAGLVDGRAALAMFSTAKDYLAFCKNVVNGSKPWDLVRALPENFEVEGLVDIGNIANFIQCITGNFDSRYFNSLKGNEYTLVKRSTNKKKIKAEYSYYHLLPEDMKYWFVMPFNYQENNDTASYTMERLHMADLAIKWVHGSMSEEEFAELMDKYFFFFRSRHVKTCDRSTYKQIADDLYIDKVKARIADLKRLPEYEPIDKLLQAMPDYSMDVLLKQYFELKDKIERRVQYPQELAIGHGDPCFANAMYNKSTKTLKFIDPKGAITEEELWTNPYYDIAKLSHSVCGRYDFFNNALYDIQIDMDFSYNLEIPFDNSAYVEIFKKKVEENGFDYLTVRIYEASLFLSMLPLHIDNPHKVFGFILNARNILKEIEENV